jgi:hypothetical protein
MEKRGWDKCGWILDGICCKDLDAARTWICEKGFPRLHGTYTPCTLPKGTKIEVCERFYEEKNADNNV